MTTRQTPRPLPFIVFAAGMFNALASPLAPAQAPFLPPPPPPVQLHIPPPPPAPFMPPPAASIPTGPSTSFQAAQSLAESRRMMDQQMALQNVMQHQLESGRQGQDWAARNSFYAPAPGAAPGGRAGIAEDRLRYLLQLQEQLMAFDYDALSPQQKVQYRAASRQLRRAIAAVQRSR